MKERAFAVIGSFALAAIAGCGPTGYSNDGTQAAEPIIGGTEDDADPSVVAIFAHQPNATSGSLCTGTVISPRAVLTAAHCVDPRSVGAGSVFEVFTGPSFGASETRLEVSSTAFDPAFDPKQLQSGHDIAVVTLAEPTKLQPIPFNQKPLDGDCTSNPVRLVGYGADTHGNTGAGTKRTVASTVDSLTSLLLRIGSSDQQTCHGDSGGPALQTIGGVETIVGVTSFGNDGSSTNVCLDGGYDTRVDEYTSFISEHL